MRSPKQKADTPEALRTKSATWTAIGDILRESDAVKAEEAYGSGLEIDERLVQLDPKDLQSQRDLSVRYNKIGIVLYEQKRFTEALKNYQNGLDIRKRLVGCYIDIPALPFCHVELNGSKIMTYGPVSLGEGRKDDEWLRRRRDLAFLALNYGKIAEVNKALDNVPAARAAAEQARVIGKELSDKCKGLCEEDRRRLMDMDAKVASIEGPLAATGGPSR
jgi:tetratricopeptide (TPR) repeat protein